MIFIFRIGYINTTTTTTIFPSSSYYFSNKTDTRLYTNTANNNNLYPISAFVLIQQPLYCQSQFNSTLPNYYNSSHPPIQDLVQPIFISSPPISPISLSSPITPIAIPVIRIDSNRLVPFVVSPI